MHRILASQYVYFITILLDLVLCLVQEKGTNCYLLIDFFFKKVTKIEWPNLSQIKNQMNFKIYF